MLHSPANLIFRKNRGGRAIHKQSVKKKKQQQRTQSVRDSVEYDTEPRVYLRTREGNNLKGESEMHNRKKKRIEGDIRMRYITRDMSKKKKKQTNVVKSSKYWKKHDRDGEMSPLIIYMSDGYTAFRNVDPKRKKEN